MSQKEKEVSEKTYTAQEAAELLEFHVEYVKQLCRQKKINAYKIGGWKIKESSLKDFMNDRANANL